MHEVMHIDRGYPHFVEDLQKLGGQIERVDLTACDEVVRRHSTQRARLTAFVSITL